MATLTFPLKGLHTGFPTGRQPDNTSRDMDNVRPYFDGKAVGGQRPALDKWGAGTQIGDDEQPVVMMCTVSSVV